ncbi:MAG: hypothetical protein IJ430_00940 [Parabacteroides sp.]|nr:hypothetical protein [Parabacteroides sp.]
MKKKLVTLAAACAVALGAYWNMNQSKEKPLLNRLALENIEAVAACETGYGSSCWIDEEYYWCCTVGVIGCAPCD